MHLDPELEEIAVPEGEIFDIELAKKQVRQLMRQLSPEKHVSLEVYGHAQGAGSPASTETPPSGHCLEIKDSEDEDSDKELLQIKVAVEDAKTRLMQLEMDGR